MRQNLEKNLKEMDTTNPPDKEFKIMVIKMFTGLERKVGELTENFKKTKKI